MALRATRWIGAGTFVLVLSTLTIGATAASFSDRVQTTGTVSADALPAPEAVEATLTGDLSAVNVTWQSAPGDFASSWELVRRTGECEGWSPPADASATADVTSPHLDSDVAAGTTYCYAIRGGFASWLSPYSSPGASAEIYVPAITRLFTHAGSANEIRSMPGTGTHRFGCLASVLGICTSTAPASYTFASTGTHLVSANSGWHASVRLQSPTAAAAGSVTISIHVWYADAACGSLPTDSTLIASGARTINVPLLGTVNGIYPIELTGAAAFTNPTESQTLCMRVHSSDPALLSLLFRYDLVHGAESWIEGPFEP